MNFFQTESKSKKKNFVGGWWEKVGLGGGGLGGGRRMDRRTGQNRFPLQLLRMR